MVAIRQAAEIFADARSLHLSALERLDAGDIRDAAEKAWCATLRATDALILARTGDVPERSPITTRELRKLGETDREVSRLKPRYYSRQTTLHGDCFYLGICEPLADTERQIRETIEYIQDAESLAGI